MSTEIRIREAAMIAAARHEAQEGTRWFSSSELICQAKSQRLEVMPVPSEWTRRRKLFAIELDDEQRFPAYALNPHTWQPLPVVAAVMNILKNRDSWFLAVWFEAVNSYLGGARPRDVLAQDPLRVIWAAQEEVKGCTHS